MHGVVWRAVEKCRRKEGCLLLLPEAGHPISLFTAVRGAQLAAGGASWL